LSKYVNELTKWNKRLELGLNFSFMSQYISPDASKVIRDIGDQYDGLPDDLKYSDDRENPHKLPWEELKDRLNLSHITRTVVGDKLLGDGLLSPTVRGVSDTTRGRALLISDGVLRRVDTPGHQTGLKGGRRLLSEEECRAWLTENPDFEIQVDNSAGRPGTIGVASWHSEGFTVDRKFSWVNPEGLRTISVAEIPISRQKGIIIPDDHKDINVTHGITYGC
jgi:hypothetical protein